MNRVTWLVLTVIASLLAGCEPELRQVIAKTQLNLSVNLADPGLREQAEELRAQLFVREATRWRTGSSGAVRTEGLSWPIDLPVLARPGDDESAEIEVLLELWGDGARLADARVVTKFMPGQVVTVPVAITRCATAELSCDGADCHGASCTECDANGTCSPVGYATASVPLERDGGAADRADAAERAGVGAVDKDGAAADADAMRDGASARSEEARDGGQALDASAGPDEASTRPDTGSASEASVPSASCPANHGCGPLHTCVPTALGYTCRGQRADWPMPDGTAGAKFAPSFTARPESVLDNVTKLEWQIGIPRVFPGCTGRTESANGVLGEYGGLCTREEAQRYCAGLTRAGQDDWRAPSLIELVSLFDMNDDTDWHRAIDGDYFGDTDYHVFVADTPAASGPTASWVVAYEYRAIFVERNVTGKVRCVRAGAEPPFAQPSERYLLASDTVSDRATQLVWQRAFSPTKLPPVEQNAYCAALGGGFRVPTANELLTLVDPTRAEPAIDTSAFPGTPSAEFATSIASVVPNYVLFSTGELVDQEAAAHVRCVR